MPTPPRAAPPARPKKPSRGKPRAAKTDDAPQDAPDLWGVNNRPSSSGDVQTAFFTLLNDTLSAATTKLLTSVCITAPEARGNPVVHVSSGFETANQLPRGELLLHSTDLLSRGSAPASLLRDLPANFGNHVEQQSPRLPPHVATMELLGPNQARRTLPHPCALQPFFPYYIPTDSETESEPHSIPKYLLCIPNTDAVPAPDPPCTLPEAGLDTPTPPAATLTPGVPSPTCMPLVGMLLVNCQLPELPVLAVNREMAEVSGFESALHWAGRSVLALAGPKSDRGTLKDLVLAARAHTAHSCTCVLYKRCGEPFYGLIVTWPLADERVRVWGEAGTKECLIGVADVTQRVLKTVGRYTLGQQVGRGASGVVRVAKPTVLEEGEPEIVAIKMVDAGQFRSISEIEQILSEIEILSALKHPNIVNMLHHMFVSNQFFFVMEYAVGGSLVSYTATQPGGKLQEAEAVEKFRQMVEAVDYCHRQGDALPGARGKRDWVADCVAPALQFLRTALVPRSFARFPY